MDDDGLISEKADYKKWFILDLWQIQEGIALLLRVEPKKYIFLYRKQIESCFSEFWNDFDVIAMMAERSINANTLKVHTNYPNYLFSEVSPIIFLNWAKTKNISMPDELLSFIQHDSETAKSQIQSEPNEAEPTLRANQIAKKVCQGIARSLWDDHPNMTIEDMKKHHAILEYGGGKHYSGKNTLRDWLSEVDPRTMEEKIGRPRSK